MEQKRLVTSIKFCVTIAWGPPKMRTSPVLVGPIAQSGPGGFVAKEILKSVEDSFIL